ncbi:biotin-dependent carboxyltransferase family protein [Mesobacillus selenatarsenatis]|uniref:Allophanate hydrolase 2 subunit 2 n=1 Tax=Mesobacillus selenatarsenatis (strain DSM 18680 / JCM 14380 / FERM P-15431 / SF-1) TaxID=1321606 RepID=A0A0A8X290_MESS1|nr:biotin-dependent carboxyltransferase family protein [Mesobacillus selenatarsenatis]GAM14105.1 allophanate hydrolase 2 subunit 2 [Mesobacillus selenatarsenatis SF-1]
MTEFLFKVLKPGLQTTIQDLGRTGYQQYGISPSGAMDPYSLQMANLLVGNPLHEAGLEATMLGPSLEAMTDVSVAICGGNLQPMVNKKKVSMWKSFVFKKGDILSFGKVESGTRAYIGFAGGIDVPLVLGSKSTFINGAMGGFNGRALEAGDIVHGRPFVRKNRFLHKEFIPEYNAQLVIRVILGPHLEKFHPDAIKRFLSNEYTISPQSNRMGFRLEGPELGHIGGADIISDAIPAGGIQVPSNGQPIILMAERQTTGGYARIATVISVDLPLLAQAMPGTKIGFAEITIKEAQELYRKQRKLFNVLSIVSR